LVEWDVDILSENGKLMLVLTPGESVMYFSEGKKITDLRAILKNQLQPGMYSKC